jgi:hypothetical protein
MARKHHGDKLREQQRQPKTRAQSVHTVPFSDKSPSPSPEA